MSRTHHFVQAKNQSKQITRPASLEALQVLAAKEGSHFWEMLTGVFDSLNQAIIIADRNGRVVVFNQVAEQVMGYQASQVVGRSSLWDFCEECDRPPLFRESLSNGHSFPEEEVEMNATQGTVGVKVTALYGQDGQLEGALAVVRSLDEIRQQEHERKNLVRLAAIGRIIAAVAHEINNPLQTVRTSLELALDPRKSEERRHHYLKAADQEISRIAHVIGQMRSFYRPSPGQKHPTHSNDKLRDAISLLQKPLSEAKVEVELSLDETLPPLNLLDYQLEQVFLNLILSAVEDMPEGGKLLIGSRRSGPKQIAISFTDARSHLGQVQLERLFDPMESRSKLGLGIGLSVSREIITELGGTIEASSEGGTTLTVYLPG